MSTERECEKKGEREGEREGESVWQGEGKAIVMLTVDWSSPSKQMEVVFEKVKAKYSSIRFVVINAESPSGTKLTALYKVEVVPSFLFFKNGKFDFHFEGASAPKLIQQIEKFSVSPLPPFSPSPSSSSSQIGVERLNDLVTSSKVIVFIKGTPSSPQCPFSEKAIEILKSEHVPFSTFDVLSDMSVRQELKDHFKFQTYPQVFVNGKPIGGVDVLTELKEKGALQNLRKNLTKTTEKESFWRINDFQEKENLQERLFSLTHSAPLVVFMKGTPTSPKCGFSSKMVDLLTRNNAKFGYFDILSDETVRENLKTYSNWPTYPQVYADGALVGGLDILTQLEEDGELKDALNLSSKDDEKENKEEEPLEKRLHALTHKAPIMLFMKGSPFVPKCGFSAKMVDLLNRNGAKFDYFDILTDDAVREGLKTYSNWPTYPQVYHEGELVGGLDVLKQLEEDGDLKSSLGLE